jgi:hypothetical protein
VPTIRCYFLILGLNSLVLRHHIMPRRDWADAAGGTGCLVGPLERGFLSLTAFHRPLLRHTVTAAGWLQQPERRLLLPVLRPEPINRLAGCVDGTLYIPPRPPSEG